MKRYLINYWSGSGAVDVAPIYSTEDVIFFSLEVDKIRRLRKPCYERIVEYDGLKIYSFATSIQGVYGMENNKPLDARNTCYEKKLRRI